ncbi:E3 ubiquitin-protein ligase lubel [Aplysia californica]|uniref:E3 ubiquitin-protein ligase lubel n=1 Tax=Aplysia californica TaxID=6500 RepID=A0ABM0K8D3_APLCA|nr:E3 ubiquitin-protein ligase lubel [Aplysia californica]
MSQSVKKAFGFVWKTMMQQLSQDSTDEDRPLEDVRAEIVELIRTGQDPADVMEELILQDYQLNDKYAILDVKQLLKWNDEGMQGLQHVQQALGFILKYARHLTKALPERSQQWREIRFTNVHVESKIKPMKGFEAVLEQLGYTEPHQHGLRFPDGCEPDVRQVHNIIADIILFRKELGIYIQGNHPHHDYIDSLLTQNTKDELLAFKLSGQQCDEEEGMDMSLFPPTRQDTYRRPLRPAPPPPVQNVLPANSLEGGAATVKQSSSVDTIQASASVVETGNDNFGMSGNVLLDPDKTEVVSSTAQENTEEEVVECIQDLVDAGPDLPTGLNSSGGQHTSSSSFISKLVCDVCGDDAVAFCVECQRKTLCDGCNVRWHQHPHRRGHKIQQISTVSSFTLDGDGSGVLIDGAYGVSAQDKQGPQRVKVPSRKSPRNSDSPSQPDADYQANTMIPDQIAAGNDLYPGPSDHQLLDYQQHLHQQSRPHTPTPQLPGYVGGRQMAGQFRSEAPYPSSHYASPVVGGNVLGHTPPGPFSAQPNQMYPPQHQVLMGAHGAGEQPGLYGLEGLVYPSRVPYTHTSAATGPNMQQMLPQMPEYIAQQIHNQSAKTAHPSQGHFNMINNNNSNAANNPLLYGANRLDPAKSQPPYPYPMQGYPQTDTYPMQSLYPATRIQPHPNSERLSYPYPGVVPTVGSSSLCYMEYPSQQRPLLAPELAGNPVAMGGGTSLAPYPSHMHPVNNYDVKERRPSLHSSSSSVSTSSVSQSKFVARLMQESDPETKRRKCELHIENLQADIQDLDAEINDRMTDDDNEFIESEEFKDMSKRKSCLMKEKKMLENFRKQMDEETQVVKLNPQLHRHLQFQRAAAQQTIYYPPSLDQPIANLVNVHGSVKSQPDAAAPASNHVLTGTVPLAEVSSSTDRVQGQPREEKILNTAPQQVSQTPPKKAPHGPPPPRPPPISAVSSTAGAIRPPVQAAKVPVENSFSDETIPVAVEPRVAPPALPPRPNIPPPSAAWDDRLDITFPPPKISNTEIVKPKPWHCEHCTFINQASSHACEMCHKTSDNPQLVSITSSMSLSSEISTTELEEQTSDENSEFGSDRFIAMLSELNQDESQIHSNLIKSKEVGARIAGIQDEVMKEKKKAQQQFQQQQQQYQELYGQGGLPQFAGSAQPGNLQQLAASPRQASPSSQGAMLRAPSPSSLPSSGARNKVPSSTTDLTSSSASGDFQTPPSRVSPTPAGPAIGADGVAGEGTVEELLGRLDQAKLIDSVEAEGAQLAQWVKMADREGFEVDAMSIALAQCSLHSLDPVQWLRTNWTNNVTQVALRAGKKGREEDQNCVGELSLAEAKAAYMSCNGNIKEAVNLCVRNRKDLYGKLSALGEFPREEILDAMQQSCGDQAACEHFLQASKLYPFIGRIWAQRESECGDHFQLQNMTSSDMCRSFSTSVINHWDFQKIIRDKNVDLDRRTRMILVEGRLKSWGRAEMVISILDQGVPRTEVSLEDVVEAVRNCRDRQSALAYLQQECQICYATFPMSKIHSLNVCQCKLCAECLTLNFEVDIREKHVRQWTCPICSLPDLNDTDVASEYLHFLSMLLQPLIHEELHNLFETKIRDWHLQKDENFRWCAHCAAGFIADNRRLCMTCPACGLKTCYSCKKKWEDQHEGLTCEQFNQWKIDNDPTNQSVGLAKHLDQNGIDCPKCKMRFDLAKGGCMHFKCPECGHEFCSGCNEAYHHKNVCQKYKNCRQLGLHCHCPRDCFSYLRDNSVTQLQQLLKQNKVDFNVDIPSDQGDAQCPVMEQKELDRSSREEKCGKDTEPGHAGLCELHYKEYLTGIVNGHRIDPVSIMSQEEMLAMLRKYDVPVPNQKQNETPVVFAQRLVQVIREKLPLRRT